MEQHKRMLEVGTRVGPVGRDALWVAPSGIRKGYVNIAVESVDGGVTLNEEEARQIIAEIQKALGES
jgi:hypothetical protein